MPSDQIVSPDDRDRRIECLEAEICVTRLKADRIEAENVRLRKALVKVRDTAWLEIKFPVLGPRDVLEQIEADAHKALPETEDASR